MGDECEMGLVTRVIGLMIDDVWIGDVNFDGFGERVIFGWSDCGKCLIFVGWNGAGGSV